MSKAPPDPHPEPPADLSNRDLPEVTVVLPLYRSYRLAYPDPLFFGYAQTYRFDAPAREYGVCYLGESIAAAFIETYGWTTGQRVVASTQLADRGMAVVRPVRPLRVINLTGGGLARISAGERICTGGDYNLSQRWALALHEHPSRCDGIRYRSRHDPSQPCIALFDRAGDAIAVEDATAMDDRQFEPALAELLERHRFTLV